MNSRLTHNAELIAMNITILALSQVRRSPTIQSALQSISKFNGLDSVPVWVGALVASSIGGYLFGYLAFFVLPR